MKKTTCTANKTLQEMENSQYIEDLIHIAQA